MYILWVGQFPLAQGTNSVLSVPPLIALHTRVLQCIKGANLKECWKAHVCACMCVHMGAFVGLWVHVCVCVCVCVCVRVCMPILCVLVRCS